jgi:hypothetical protein
LTFSFFAKKTHKKITPTNKNRCRLSLFYIFSRFFFLCHTFLWKQFCPLFIARKKAVYKVWPGLPDGYFQTKNPNLGIFWRALDWKMFLYFMAVSNILRTFEIFYDHLVHFVSIWYIFSVFGIMYHEKSGNPESGHSLHGKMMKTKP